MLFIIIRVEVFHQFVVLLPSSLVPYPLSLIRRLSFVPLLPLAVTFCIRMKGKSYWIVDRGNVPYEESLTVSLIPEEKDVYQWK